jgi:RNA polymerase sigma factor (sigma-70 family)
MGCLNERLVKDIKEDLPLLSADREKELGIIIQDSKDASNVEDAVAELVQHNLRLALKEANRYSRNYGIDLEELYSAGRLGLVKAAYGYNPVKYNTRFSTYATSWVRQGIREILHGNSSVKIPVHIINGMYKKNQVLGHSTEEMSNEEVREELGLTEDQMDRINKAKISTFSLNTPMENSKGESDSTYADIVPDDNAEIPGQNDLTDVRYDYLEEAMAELDETSREILKSQILDSDKTKLSDLGERYGMSGERVRQIKAKALKALKKKILYRMSLNR